MLTRVLVSADLISRLRSSGLADLSVREDPELGYVLAAQGGSYFVASFMHEDDARLVADLVGEVLASAPLSPSLDADPLP